MTEKGCDNCYYTYFDERAYPCSLCIRGIERTDQWQPSKKTKADRKTENSSEIPNNCEVKNYCDDCLYTDTCDSKEFFYACTSKATISKMEQVDKDINVRSKTEPQTEVKVEPTWVGVTYGRFEDEPQIDGAIDEAKFKAHCMNCQRDVADIKCLDCDGDKYFIPDEPQTDCSWK